MNATKFDLPHPNRHRLNLTTLYDAHADIRWFVVPGDQVISQGTWSTVRSVTLHRAGNHPHSPIQDRLDAVQVSTDHGDRWFGYPIRVLAKSPASHRSALW